MSETFVITAKAENVLRVLQKLTSFMSRKRLKMQDIQVNQTAIPSVACLTLSLQAEAEHVRWLVKQMKKCVDLFDLDFKLQKNETKHDWKDLYLRSCGFVL